MHTTSYKFSDFNTPIPHQTRLAGRTGAVLSTRKSPVLSRQELQRLILDMVG